MKRPFTKPPITYAQQVTLLQQRGMQVDDPATAEFYLQHITITPLLPRNKPAGLVAQCRVVSRKLYNTLVILLHCMDVIAPRHHWRMRLKDLIARHAIPVGAMNFPNGWERLAIWMDTTT